MLERIASNLIVGPYSCPRLYRDISRRREIVKCANDSLSARATKYGRGVREPSACPLWSRTLLRKRPDSTAQQWRENALAGADSYLPANDRIPAWNFRPRYARKK